MAVGLFRWRDCPCCGCGLAPRLPACAPSAGPRAGGVCSVCSGCSVCGACSGRVRQALWLCLGLASGHWLVAFAVAAAACALRSLRLYATPNPHITSLLLLHILRW